MVVCFFLFGFFLLCFASVFPCMLKHLLFRIGSHHVYVACRTEVEEVSIDVPASPGKKGRLPGCLHLPFSCLELSSVPVQ